MKNRTVPIERMGTSCDCSPLLCKAPTTVRNLSLTGSWAQNSEPMTDRKKLIEVALPLDAINAAAAREKSIRHGHPSTLHLWWARRPLAAARAVIFAQMVDDPSGWPELFPTEQAQEQERQRLFDLICELVKWESTTNETVLQAARHEIRESWRRSCADNAEHPRAAELFVPERLPAFHDPFAGGGALPLEAQRLGLEAHASDLNPVAVLINKAMVEIPPKFAGSPPVNPDARSERTLIPGDWTGTRGLAEDVRHYGRWMRDEAQRRIGHLYPKIAITDEMLRERSDLKPYAGRELTVIAWLWVRTVKSPNPAFADVDVPLVSTFMLSTKKGREAYVDPVIEAGGYRFMVKVGIPHDVAAVDAGTSAGKRHAFRCLMSGVPVTYEYIRSEGQAGRMGARLMSVVAEGDRRRVYLSPTAKHEAVANVACPVWTPETKLPANPRDFKTPLYGISTFGELFTRRQLVVLNTLSELVTEARKRIRQDAAADLRNGDLVVHGSGMDGAAYGDAVGMYLAFALSKALTRNCTQTVWYRDRDSTMAGFSRQAIPMTWDFAEVNPLLNGTGSIAATASWVGEVIEGSLASAGATTGSIGQATQMDAARASLTPSPVISTDPPYYDNISYADLSDFFYIWLRRSLKSGFQGLFSTMEVPKSEELVATPYRHGTRAQAEAFFMRGMTQAMQHLAQQAHPGFPTTIYYAFKQSESRTDGGMASTGWATFLDAVISAGFSITGTWPVRTEQPHGLRVIDTNALASSVVLVCRKRSAQAPLATRRDLIAALTAELPSALAHLRAGNIAPVDLAQAAIGPGMAVYTRYAKVLDAAGIRVSVGEALVLINQTLDEILAGQEGDFDADSRWALAWFEQHGFDIGAYGNAETLSKAKNTNLEGMGGAGFLRSQAGTVRLLRPREYALDWDPSTDDRLSAWKIVHHLIRVLEQGGEPATAELVLRLGGWGEIARDLCYRLYTLCERKRRAAEALSYNMLVRSWPEITRLARMRAQPQQSELFDDQQGTGTAR